MSAGALRSECVDVERPGALSTLRGVELVEVVVYTRDMARATAFYRDTLGLEPNYESEHWTTFRTGACTLALHAGSEVPDPTFEVADVESERARLAARGVDVTEIREPAPGLRVFDARDPDGNRFSLESRGPT
jgi:catechol 2,3-dioxygenase-like lactoylglutathione lyase family enzyme